MLAGFLCARALSLWGSQGPAPSPTLGSRSPSSVESKQSIWESWTRPLVSSSPFLGPQGSEHLKAPLHCLGLDEAVSDI